MTVWVGGLGPRVKEEQIRRTFEKYGQVGGVQIIYERGSGRSRGFAFVDMQSLREAETAISLVSAERGLGKMVYAKLAESRAR